MGATSATLLLVVPIFSWIAAASAAFVPGWPGLLPGLFAQAGIAEETLFRGYLFGRLRHGRSFRQAMGLSMLPFVAVHLLLFVTMPWQVAVAALLLSVDWVYSGMQRVLLAAEPVNLMVGNHAHPLHEIRA